MTLKPRRILIVLLLLNIFLSPASADLYEVTFQAVDENDQPISEVEIASRWILDLKPEQLFKPAFNIGTTDKEGKCIIEFDNKYQQEHVALAYSADRKLSGVAIVESQDAGETVKIRMMPVISVKAKYFCPYTKEAPEWSNTIVSIEGIKGYFFEYRSKDGEIEYPLPPGTWNLRMYGQGIIAKKEKLVTNADEPIHDLGKINFEVDAMVKLRGKPAPELTIVDKRGVDNDFKLSDLKGKWVLLEFWGFW